MKMVRLVCSLLLLLMCLISIGIPGMAMAQDEEPVTDNATLPEGEEPTPELIMAPEEEPAPEEAPAPIEILRLRPAFPTVEAIAGADFEYEMECLYVGQETSKTFDLRATAPKGWEVYMTPRYEKEKKISSINLKPSFSTGETIRVVVTAPFWPLPDPGDYNITIEAISDTLETSVELTATVTARYNLVMVPTLEKYNTEVEAGKDNYFSMEVASLSTAPIDNIKFSSTKPEGWAVEFNPEDIELLEAVGSTLDSQTVELNIKPPKDTIAGDYYITVRATGKQATTDEIQIRITVKTAPTWQWVGVGIIVIVVAAVIYIFMRFSRR
jgi:uncharacterized membrane protein